MNIGDVLFQLGSFGFVFLIIVLFVLFVRAAKKRSRQLDRLEQKVNEMEQRAKRNE